MTYISCSSEFAFPLKSSDFAFFYFYASNFEEVEGAYCFGSVHQSVHLFIHYTRIWSKIGRGRILKFYILNKHEK